MPAFSGALADDEIENVVAFVLSWERQPVSDTIAEDDDTGSFNWLVALLFVIVIMAVVVWLVTHFSQRREPT